MSLFKTHYSDDTYDGQGSDRNGSRMEVISHNWEEGEMSWRYPHNEIHKGNHLIVGDTQAVLFYNSGQLCDVFNRNGGEGQNVVLDVRNIPFLSKLVNLPWGQTPWPADIYFVNLVPFREMFWGTPNPVNILDSSLGDYPIPIPIRCAVQYGVRITDPTMFMREIVGTTHIITKDDIENRFAGTISSKFSVVTSTLMRTKGISALDVNLCLEDLSVSMGEALQNDITKYGMKLESFHFLNFSPDLEDANVKAIYEARAKRSQLGALGIDYRTERQLDIMQTAASNEGASGQIMGAGMGVGMGFGMGSAFGSQMGNIATSMQPTPPPMPNASMFYIYLNGAQAGPYNIQQIQQFIHAGQISRETLVWTNGMPQWVTAGTSQQLMNLFVPAPPTMPPAPTMH